MFPAPSAARRNHPTFWRACTFARSDPVWRTARYDEPVARSLYDQMAKLWKDTGTGLESHALVLPGDAGFVCQADLCDAWCCRNLTVALDDADADRIERSTGAIRPAFLECEDGNPIALPLVQPYLLGRRDGACVFLAADRRCSTYAGRPDACRLYPHSLLFVDAETGKPLSPLAPDRRAAVEAALDGRGHEMVPLVIRHLACPGFTGPPLDESAWRALLGATYALQFRDPLPSFPRAP